MTIEPSDHAQIKALIAAYCKPDANGCWIWTRSYRGNGYAQLTLSGRRQVAGNRAAYSAFHGAIPAGMFVCHSCDVPACCNPEHLFLGTPKDNTQDCVRKGRLRPGRVGAPKKLVDSDKSRIRELRVAGLLQREIARLFNVSQVRVSQVLRAVA